MAAPARTALLAAAIAWSAYSTLSLAYLVLGVSLVWALKVLTARRDWPLVPADPGFRLMAALWLWLAVSALWSPAPAADRLSHLWSLTLPMAVPVLALALPAASARRGLRHFAWASAVAALLIILAHQGWLPRTMLWQRVVDSEGNQRIAISLWLALGAAIAVHDAATSADRRSRLVSAALALLCIGGEATQDRRSGMLMLLALLGLSALWLQPTRLRRIGVLAVLAIAAAGLWLAADGVRARFAEGARELQSLPPPERVDTSWGQRAYMLQITAAMVAERPLTGHGLGSWPVLWQSRTPAGSALRAHSTPHNEYLLLAVQGGLPAVLLWIAVLAARWRACWRIGPPALPAALVWLTIGLGGLFNAILRDAKFELTLLLLAALATAAARPDQSGGVSR